MLATTAASAALIPAMQPALWFVGKIQRARHAKRDAVQVKRKPWLSTSNVTLLRRFGSRWRSRHGAAHFAMNRFQPTPVPPG